MEPILAQPPKDPNPQEAINVPLGTTKPLNPSSNQIKSNIPAAKIEEKVPGESTARVGNDNHDGLKSVLTTFSILILAPLIAFALTAFIFQSYQVDGSSMETTLQNEDRLIVLKLPRTIAKITHNKYVPNRGDVIIFNKNNLSQFEGANQKKQLVKRVIGLPGDHIIVKDGTYVVINKTNPDGFQPDKTLPYGKDTAGTLAGTTCTGEFCDIVVPQGEVYVSGDNRGNSLDSRIFGPVSEDEIVGKLALRIFPFNKAKKF